MTHRPWAALAALACLAAAAAPAAAQDKSVRPGINQPFENPDVREFIAKFEVESREVYTHRNQIVAACKLQPGMAVADVGAGTGLFTRLFARAVGPAGKVYAVDIAPKFVAHVEKTAQEAGLRNVRGVVCTASGVSLPPNSVDLVFVCDTYHHFEFPFRTLASIHEALRPGGRLVVVDFRRVEGKSREWVLNHVRAGQEVVTQEIVSAGFRKTGEEDFLKENYVMRFQKVERADGGDAKEPQTVLVPRDDRPFTAAAGDLVRLTGKGIAGAKIEAKVEGPAKVEAVRVVRELANGRPLLGTHVREFDLKPTGRGRVTVTVTVTPPQPHAEPQVRKFQFDVH